MNKKLITLIITLLSVSYNAFAQKTTESPYSFYGVGERNFNGIAEESAMGNIGVFADSTRVNMQNPATLSELKYTAFSAGMTMQSKKIVTNNTSINARSSAFDYFTLGFPIIDRLGVSFGLVPYSSVGYQLKSETYGTTYQYQGNGNVNQFFASAGYKLRQGLSLGATVRYNFGTIQMTDIQQLRNVEFFTQEDSKSVIKGATFNLGLYYEHPLQHRLRLYSSLVYTPQSVLRSDNERSISTLGYASGSNSNRGAQLSVREVQQVNLSAQGIKKTNLTMGSQIEAGIGIGEQQKWFAGLEYTYANTSKFANPFLTTTNVSYKDSYKIEVGGFWIPNYNSFTSYWKRVTYRAGFHYENTGAVLNRQALTNFGTSFGLSLPVKGFSNITTVFEYGKRGTLSAGLLKENYFNLKIGFTLNDKWFQKTKYQ